MAIAGKYECVTKTPMGDQTSIFTVIVDGATFTGTNAGAMGSLDIDEGKVDGNTLTWTSQLTTPMPMKLEGKATIDGDSLNGTVTAGMFGSFAMTGKRVG